MKTISNTYGALFLLTMLGPSACLPGPSFYSQKNAVEPYQLRTATDTESGAEFATVKANFTVPQEIQVTGTSPVSGTSVTFPPGSLAVDTSISIEEGVPLAVATTAAQLNIGDSIRSSGVSVAVQAAAAVDSAQPFTLSIELPAGSGLRLADDYSNLVVLYKARIASEERTVIGVIPRSEITLGSGKAVFTTRYFGIYQTALLTVPVAEKKEVSITTPILTRYMAAALPALAVTARTPFIVGAQGRVEISGKNFRPTMVIAMGGKQVSGLTVASDVKASFVAPSYQGFGLTNLAVEQDGTTQTVNLFYTGSASDYPLITLGAAEVCSGQKFYNASGELQTGTKTCSSQSLEACSADGQVDCVANTAYKAAAISGLAAKVSSGLVVAGVTGTAGTEAHTSCSGNGSQNCVATGTYYAATSCGPNSSNCYLPGYITTTQPLKAIDYDAINNGKSSIRSSLTLAGIAGTLADCNTGNLSGCVTTTTFKSMDLSAAGTATGLTSANFQTRIATAANSEFWDATGARHSITGDADLSVGNVKAGVVIHSVTGQYPSSTYPLASNTASTDLTLFSTQLTTEGTFEFFDSAGARYTGSGDSDLVNGNIKNAIEISSLGLTGSYPGLNCPSGWIKVPGDSAFGTADFCVMKYEAKSVSSVATSQASLTPWANISQTDSITTCRALGTGYDLISNPQWMTIGANAAGISGNWTGGTVGSGYLFAGHSDNSPAAACAAASNDTDFYVEASCAPANTGDGADQRRTLNLANGDVIWDLSGNVAEWVNYLNVGDKPLATAAYYEYTAFTGTSTTALKDLVPTNAVKAFWSDTWNAAQWIGKFYPGANDTGGALLRGGKYSEGTSAGVFAANLGFGPTAGYTYTGFRCTSAPSP